MSHAQTHTLASLCINSNTLTDTRTNLYCTHTTTTTTTYVGVVQIRETSTGTYPPVVYQPLRSPKSPYAKFGPGSSSTLPAKFGNRLLNQRTQHQPQSRATSGCDAAKARRLNEIARKISSGKQSPVTDKVSSDLIVEIASQTDNRNHLEELKDEFEPIINDNALISPEDVQLASTINEDSARQLRGCSEDDSNASSDHNSGYFSEDSSQSMADLSGSPLELKVQIRQCSDEKILKKNLSQDNLLKADYISRPNEKCMCIIQKRCLFLKHFRENLFSPTNPHSIIIPPSDLYTQIFYCSRMSPRNTSSRVYLTSKWEPDNTETMQLRRSDIVRLLSVRPAPRLVLVSVFVECKFIRWTTVASCGMINTMAGRWTKKD